jgi:hypothetical protein
LTQQLEVVRWIAVRRRIREHAILELSSSIPVEKYSDGVENDESNEEDKELPHRKDIASREILNLLACYEVVLHARMNAIAVPRMNVCVSHSVR